MSAFWREGSSRRPANGGLGSNYDLRHPLELGLEFSGEPTFGTELRQYGGFRPFKLSGLNTRFVPETDVARALAWHR